MKTVWVFFALCLLLPVTSFAAAAKESLHLRAQLVAEVSEAAPGSTFFAGIEFKLDKGWHVYWQNPGDYGQPAQLNWKQSEGFEYGKFRWPLPKRIQSGTIVSFGYLDEVLLPFPITIPKSTKQKSITLEPEVKWLVCAEVCIPGKATLKLTIPINPSGAVINAAYKAKFDAAQSMVPLAQPASLKISGTLNADNFIVRVAGLPKDVEQVEILPTENGKIDYVVPATTKKIEDGFELTLKRSDRLTDEISLLPAVVIVHSANADTAAYQVDVSLGPLTTSTPAVGSILGPLVFAFLGGLLLNLMPCVFPVLSIKAMGVLKMSGEAKSHVRKLGWAYTLGILCSFWALVGTLIFLRIGGRQIGWGFQLQSPQFVFVLACLLFAFSLNLLGFFEFSGAMMGAGDTLTRRPGWTGSFFTGVLATVVATPCSAPFMGSAVGFALSQPPLIIFLIFSMLGFGLALPYLLICYLPVLGRILPKPGAWMRTFQQLMAFLILATILWLAWVLSFQIAASGLVLLLAAFVGIGFAVWINERSTWLAVALGIIFVVGAASSLQKVSADQGSLAIADSNGLKWEKFSPEKIVSSQSEGRPVFVDFTAAWCVSCHVNEALIFHSDAVIRKLKDLNFVLLKADWTNEDPVITQALHGLGRDGVPYYVIYPKGQGKTAVTLPEVLDADIVLTQLNKLEL